MYFTIFSFIIHPMPTKPIPKPPKVARVKATTAVALTLKDDPMHRWRFDNFGRLLLVAFTHWDARLLEQLRATGFSNLKAVHLTCLRYLDFDGTRIAELASRAGLTKAGMGQLVSQCERLGFVSVKPDAQDARAKRVAFTPLGWSIIEANHRVIETTEAELKTLVGAPVFDQIQAGLVELRNSLEHVEPTTQRAKRAKR
jgi:DNA-binding MarR family transcriptional regulator